MGVGGASRGSRKQNKDPWELHLQWKKRGSKWQENVHCKKYTPTSSPSTGPPRTARRSSNMGFILSYGLPLPAEQMCIGSRGILSLMAWGSPVIPPFVFCKPSLTYTPGSPRPSDCYPSSNFLPQFSLCLPWCCFHAGLSMLPLTLSKLVNPPQPAPMTSDPPSSKKATLILPSLALWPSAIVFVIHCVQALFPPRLWAPWKWSLCLVQFHILHRA